MLSWQCLNGDDRSQKTHTRRWLWQPPLDTGHCLDQGKASDDLYSLVHRLYQVVAVKLGAADQAFNDPLWVEMIASLTPKNKWVKKEISFSGELMRKQG